MVLTLLTCTRNFQTLTKHPEVASILQRVSVKVNSMPSEKLSAISIRMTPSIKSSPDLSAIHLRRVDSSRLGLSDFRVMSS